MRKRANRERRQLSFREPRHLPHQAAAFFITERRAAVSGSGAARVFTDHRAAVSYTC